jgi:hydrogenase maturation protein HypF
LRSTEPTPNTRRLAITVRGVVQGVGFRPFVYRTARACGLIGWVQNQADAVRLEVSGTAAGVADFLGLLRSEAPPQARIDSVAIEELPPVSAPALTGGTFEIRSAAGDASPRPTIPADLATCDACREEIGGPNQRRYRYPFTNCTNCGPRWSIIQQLPYDRPRTSMAQFPMCPACQAEYDDPADRRFHAQPIACPRCGPQLRLLDARGRVMSEHDQALQATAAALAAGQVVALQGLGGFQLLVDATDAPAIDRLRQRKHRPDRPFALMFHALDAVRQCCLVSDDEARELLSPAAPILLLRRLVGEDSATYGSAGPNIAANVAPGNPYLGVMLPYTPLHHLLLEAVARPLVCTSGNLSEEPMAIEIDDALHRLGSLGQVESQGQDAPAAQDAGGTEGIADLLLVHNRPIVRPVDDSVARVGPDGLQVLRRARGFAPLPIRLNFAAATILAVGGHLKNTVALAIGGEGSPSPPAPLPSCRVRQAGEGRNASASVVLSQHIGDLESPLSLGVFQRSIDDLLEFFAVEPQAVACDLHPDYASTRYAEELARRFQVPIVRVQHHHAHVAACMAEHGLDGPVLGLSWDGTGYGPDGTIWGGEALLCRAADYRRVAHLRTFSLPGGDQAARQPRRSALGLLYEILGPDALENVRGWFSSSEQRALAAMLARGLNCPRTSSMGRLFDAVAALCGLGQEMTFEGQAAMSLEFAAEARITESYHIPLRSFNPQPTATEAQTGASCGMPLRPAENGLIADWEPMARQILTESLQGEAAGRISARFHNALADLALDLARAAHCDQVVLTGGCFQNNLLTWRVRRRLLEGGLTVHAHQRVPPGDGGIALGQVFVAARQMQGSIDVPGNSR